MTTALLVHLVAFAAYFGAAFAQMRMMQRSSAAGLAPAVRDEYEALAAAITTKIEVPAILASMLSGMFFVSENRGLLMQPWLHGKLGCVLILLLLSHLEMINARKIVQEREASAPGVDASINARKRRHRIFGIVGTVTFATLLILVTYVRHG